MAIVNGTTKARQSAQRKGKGRAAFGASRLTAMLGDIAARNPIGK